MSAHRLNRLLTAASLFAVLSGTAAFAEAPLETAAQDSETKEVIVLGKRVIRNSAGATGLDLSLRQTPQSVTIVSAAQMKEFALTDANQLLATIPGVNVESTETDRTGYNSRGFDIVNFQVDGVGQPLDWGLQTGALDVAIYDRIEVIRGANGMMTGTGNPSATINYIRKRPTKDFRASVQGSYGSWDNFRATGDVSGPLTEDGAVTGRFVYARTDTDSYLDYYHVDRAVYHGVLSWDVTEKLNATAGFTQQDNLADGNNWGALPLVFSDGTLIDSDVSDNSGAPWTYWDTHTKSQFAELSYRFDNGWTLKGTFNRKDYNDEAKLLYAYGNPDPVTGEGTLAMSGIYPSKLQQNMFDIIANGDISLFGRDHEVVFGFNTSTNETHKWEAFADFFAYTYDGDHIQAPAEPVYPDAYLAEETEDRLTRAYAAIHINFTDNFKGIAGFNAIDVKTTGYSYGTPQDRKENKVSPYVGAVLDVSENVSLYASYTDIFSPQAEGDINHNRLPAVQGKSYEAGVKFEWFDRRLYATASVFKSEQYGLAEFAGYIPDTIDSYYIGVDTFVEGYEFEIAGKVTQNWAVNGGWTELKVEDADGNDTRTYLPRRTLKLSTTYSLPQLRDLRLGAAYRWQSTIYTTDIGATITQKAYSVVDLTASIRVSDHVRASLNVKNAFDTKYFNSLMWNQAYWAAPSSAIVSLDWTF